MWQLHYVDLRTVKCAYSLSSWPWLYEAAAQRLDRVDLLLVKVTNEGTLDWSAASSPGD